VLLDDPYVFRAVVDTLQMGICLTDCQRRFVYWNRGAEQISGFMRHEVLGRKGTESGICHYNAAGTQLGDDESPLAESIRDGKRLESQLYLRHKAGHQVPVKIWTVPIRDEANLIIGAAESFQFNDTLSAQSRHHSTLAAHGCLDFVTGLPSHNLTQSRLRESLALFSEYHLPFGVLCVQLEDLSQFESAHSSEAMHAILHVSAQTIAHVLDATTFLGRWAEHQFLAVIPECDRVELEKLRREVHRAVNCGGIQWWGDPLSVRASVGWAMAELNDTMDSLLTRALPDLPPAADPVAMPGPRAHGSPED